MNEFITAHTDWLTAIRMPAYAPELNRVEAVRANLKNGLGNLAVRSVDQLAAVVKTQLKRIQYRPELIDSFLTQTGLSPEDKPP
jgi:putative transposase